MGFMDSGGGAGEDYLPHDKQLTLEQELGISDDDAAWGYVPDRPEIEAVSGFWLHQITYFRRPGHRRKHGWRCACGEGSNERTSAKAQRRVAVHLFFSKKDYEHCWGEDARQALAPYGGHLSLSWSDGERAAYLQGRADERADMERRVREMYARWQREQWEDELAAVTIEGEPVDEEVRS